ncbi:hypothetical protein ACPOLB_23605 [Rubrivivax sp. RP6-9]|uniref:hypothetical protein n=1 Tax=Rubrivivax sp. RP6-9 TaxID=3415750 RepID=UPI003CC56AF9
MQASIYPSSVDMWLIRASRGRLASLRLAGNLVVLLAGVVLLLFVIGEFNRPVQSERGSRYIWAVNLLLAGYNVWAFTHGRIMLTGAVGENTSVKSAYWRVLCLLLFAALGASSVLKLFANDA